MKIIIYVSMNINKEDTMNDDKKEASALGDLKEALVLRPDWEIKPKQKQSTQVFTVTFHEDTKVLELHVNGAAYSEIDAKDTLANQIRYHEVLSNVVNKFELWRIREKN
tara:strand:+ start:351 stop:677 length:327 start_codon:yes stop_codon:yes gene_type:complete